MWYVYNKKVYYIWISTSIMFWQSFLTFILKFSRWNITVLLCKDQFLAYQKNTNGQSSQQHINLAI